MQDQILAQMGLSRLGKPTQSDPKSKKDSLKPSELNSLVKAWEGLEDRKRILRGKGLPKPVDGIDGKHKRLKVFSGPSES